MSIWLRRTQAPLPPLPDAFAAQQRLLAGRDPKVILDVGAHRGETATRYHALFPEATIYSFEPFPESFQVLRDRFQTTPAVQPIHQAVADATGQREFFVNGFSGTNSLFPRPGAARRYYPACAEPKTTIQVPVTALDDFLREKDLTHVDILKFDIQGGELLALQGARRLLAERRVALIYTEVFFVAHYEGGASFCDLSRFLAEYGYTLFNLYNLCIARNGQLRFGDALFISESIRAGVVDRSAEEP